MKQSYPTFIFNTNDGLEHPFLVCVPDLEIFTEGNTFTNAIGMTRDAIGLTGITMEDYEKELPLPSNQEEAIALVENYAEDIDFSKGVLTFVDVDFDEYRRKTETKTVRRNVTLPSWLNYEADQAGINVSRVLQEALISVLKLERKL